MAGVGIMNHDVRMGMVGIAGCLTKTKLLMNSRADNHDNSCS